MYVLITKGSAENMIKEIVPKVKFQEQNQHQVAFNVSRKTFEKIYDEVKAKGLNPYAVMYWQ